MISLNWSAATLAAKRARLAQFFALRAHAGKDARAPLALPKYDFAS
jgi:hypothetical protein